MKTVKKTAEYTIFLRNDSRHAVRSNAKKWINGAEKVAILEKEGLMKRPEPKPKAEEVTEAPAEGGEA